jgi:GT2 family glycosyltransferase
VIIPFKDEKKGTLAAAKSAFQQVGVEVFVTAIDNESLDGTIKEELERLGVEVLTFNEPFNYSKINNFAINQSGCEYPLLVFLNNDVVLDKSAFLEMCRFASLKDLGLIGCRLHYPSGLLQHGGVHKMKELWVHIEKNQKKLDIALEHAVVDAVTAAACMIEREKFLEVRGFDEVSYPIAYSDTDLATRLKAKGYQSFYTPFATGIHFESKSRKKGHQEDYESSSWLEEFLKNESH